jgi:hypothetical protein
MKIRPVVIFLCLLIFLIPSRAVEPKLDNPYIHPPRIIRTCCMFGSKVGVAVN